MKKLFVLSLISMLSLSTATVSFAHPSNLTHSSKPFSHKVAQVQMLKKTGISIDLNDLLHEEHSFALRDPKTGMISYTRSGDFLIMDGYFYQRGKRLQGYALAADLVGNACELSDIHLSYTIAPHATSQIDMRFNLNSNTAVVNVPFNIDDYNTFSYQLAINVYDSLGDIHLVQMFFIKKMTNDWSAYVYVDRTMSAEGHISFDTMGQIVQSESLSYITFYPMNGAASPQVFSMTFAGSTQFAIPFSVTRMDQDGNTVGDLNSILVDDIGYVTQGFTNGEKVSVGKIAIVQ